MEYILINMLLHNIEFLKQENNRFSPAFKLPTYENIIIMLKNLLY